MWIRNLGMAQLAGGTSRFLMSCSQGVGWAVEAETRVSRLLESGSWREMIRDGGKHTKHGAEIPNWGSRESWSEERELYNEKH